MCYASFCRQLMATGLLLFTGYCYSFAQKVMNLEPEVPATIALSQQDHGKVWYDNNSKTWCSIHNNDKALYIQLVIADPLQQQKVIENGIEIWIDAKGKKKKSTGIAFPLPAKPSAAGSNQPSFDQRTAPPAPTPSTGKQAPTQLLKSRLSMQREMQLTGFLNELNGVQNCDHPSGLHVSMQFDNDTLVYQAVIPFQTMTKPIGFNTPVSIGIIQKGRLLQPSGDMPGFGEPGEEGMMPPPGPPPGMDAPDEDDDDHMRQLWEDNIVWYKVVCRKS